MDLFGDEVASVIPEHVSLSAVVTLCHTCHFQVQYLARCLHSMDDRLDPLDDDEEEQLLPTAKTGWSSRATSAGSAGSAVTAAVDDSIDSPQVIRPAPPSARLSASSNLFQTSFLDDYQAEFELCSVNTQSDVSLFDTPPLNVTPSLNPTPPKAIDAPDEPPLTCNLLGPTTLAAQDERYAQRCSLSLLASALPAPRLHLLCYQLQADGVVEPAAVQRLVHNVLTSFPTDHLQASTLGCCLIDVGVTGSL